MSFDESIAPDTAPVKKDWPVIGARVSPEDRRLIDRAALEVEEKRGPFIAAAALERARAILAEQDTV
jgi:uncharacterized protein (DUF1778 family)